MQEASEQSFYSIPNNSSKFEQPSQLAQPYQAKNIQQISIINAHQHNDSSISLKKQIDCLQNYPNQDHIQQKIQILQHNQKLLEKELLMAKSVLQVSNQKNELLEKQIYSYRKEEEMKKVKQGVLDIGKQINFYPSRIEVKESRVFKMSNNQKSASEIEERNKNVYRKCAMEHRASLHQTDLYEIFVEYGIVEESEKVLRVKLTLVRNYEHQESNFLMLGMFFNQKISEQEIIKFPLSHSNIEISIDIPSYVPKNFITTIMVVEQREEKTRVCHQIMVPLPMNKFLERRLENFSSKHKQSQLKRILSRYELQFPIESICKYTYTKMKENSQDYQGKVCNLLGHKELIMYEMEQIEKDNIQQIKVKVFGKKSSVFVSDLIEFVCFCMIN